MILTPLRTRTFKSAGKPCKASILIQGMHQNHSKF
jgi:hypothetical protein